MFDVIGDIHGQGDALIALLEELGYRQEDGAYRHPDRKVIFVGDFVDREDEVIYAEAVHIFRRNLARYG